VPVRYLPNSVNLLPLGLSTYSTGGRPATRSRPAAPTSGTVRPTPRTAPPSRRRAPSSRPPSDGPRPGPLRPSDPHPGPLSLSSPRSTRPAGSHTVATVPWIKGH